MMNIKFKIIETDAWGRDPPDESFLNLEPMVREHAENICTAINSTYPHQHQRHWRFVPSNYILKPGNSAF